MDHEDDGGTDAGTAEKRLFICRMLDRHRVGRGDKAVGIFLAEHWTREMEERFGPPGAPRTIREWLKLRGRPDDRSLDDMLDLRTTRARRATRSSD